MKKKMILAAVVAVAALLPFSGVQAFDETCSYGSGSADAMHLEDTNGDWEGVLTGNEAGLYGDVNRESADILGMWFSQVGNKHYVNVSLGSIGDPTRGLDVNQYLYVLFDNPRSKLSFQRQFVSAVFNGRGTATFSYGDFGPDPDTGIGTYSQRGGTVGTVTSGSPATIQIELKLNPMGQPQPGDVLGALAVETRMVLGTTATGGLFLGYTDDTSNGEGCLEGVTI